MKRNSHLKLLKKIGSFFFIIVLISSCHIEKRIYLPGFYINWNVNFHKENNNNNYSKKLEASSAQILNNSAAATYTNKDSIKEKPASSVVGYNSQKERFFASEKKSLVKNETLQISTAKQPPFSKERFSFKQLQTINQGQTKNKKIQYNHTPEWLYWWNILLVSVLFTPVFGWGAAKLFSRGPKSPDPIGFIACWALFAFAYEIVSTLALLGIALYLLSVTLCMFKFYNINITKILLPFMFKN
jgi:4-amino-4-deoxy-L-arabinose transferase-like glycosyltransferase